MEKFINIKNEQIATYIMFKLNKIDNAFTIEELSQITELLIEDTGVSDILMSDIEYLSNLTTLTIRNTCIYNGYYKYFKNLSTINFMNCEFIDPSLIETLKLKELSLINCAIENYSFISSLTSLERLSIVNATFDFNLLSKLDKLTYLRLSSSNISGNIDSLSCKNLNNLYLDNTNITQLDCVKSFNKLKELHIDLTQYDNNKSLAKDLKNKKILVMYNDIVLGE